MPNPVFQLVKTKQPSFQKQFGVTQRAAKKTNAQYLFLEPVIFSSEVILINTVPYTVNQYHISIYEDLKIKNDHKNTSYHLTLLISNKDNSQTLTARIYFNSSNKVLFLHIKDQKKTIIKLNSTNDIVQVAKSYSQPFFDCLWNVYQESKKEFESRYTPAVSELDETSRSVITATSLPQKQTALTRYLQQLDNILIQLEAWKLLDLQANTARHTLLLDIKGRMSIALSQIITRAALPVTSTVEEVENKSVVEASTTVSVVVESESTVIAKRLLTIENELSALEQSVSLPLWKKLIQEQRLLSEKFELVKKDDDVLNCFLRIKAIEKQVVDEFTTILTTDAAYATLSPDDFNQLISFMPSVTFSLFTLAVQHNRHVALQVMIIRHSAINIEAPVTDTTSGQRVYLLESAYDSKALESFRVLLAAGVYCDFENRDGLTLLMRACFDKRQDEMIALLKAGASTTKRNPRGFTAFSYFTMSINTPPDLASAKVFIENCPSFYIDLYQGKMGERGTPLQFACQMRWPNAVRFYLANGANPQIGRERDSLSALAICAYKGFEDLLDVIFAETTCPIEGTCLTQARNAALQFSKGIVVTKIDQYARSKNIKLTTQYGSVLGANASLNELFRRLGAAERLAADVATTVPVSVIVNPSLDNSSQSTVLSPLEAEFELLVQDIQNNNESEVRRRIRDGFNVNERHPKGGKTLLHIAAHFGNASIAGVLLDLKADVNARTEQGFIPLHVAAQQGHANVIEVLVQRGAGINDKNSQGSTALHEAAAKGYKDATTKLLVLGADASIRDDRYHLTAVNVARDNQHMDLYKSMYSALSYQQRFIQGVAYILFGNKLIFTEQRAPNEYRYLDQLEKSLFALNDAPSVYKAISDAIKSLEFKAFSVQFSQMRQLLIDQMKLYNAAVTEENKAKEAAASSLRPT